MLIFFFFSKEFFAHLCCSWYKCCFSPSCGLLILFIVCSFKQIFLTFTLSSLFFLFSSWDLVLLRSFSHPKLWKRILPKFASNTFYGFISMYWNHQPIGIYLRFSSEVWMWGFCTHAHKWAWSFACGGCARAIFISFWCPCCAGWAKIIWMRFFFPLCSGTFYTATSHRYWNS